MEWKSVGMMRMKSDNEKTSFAKCESIEKISTDKARNLLADNPPIDGLCTRRGCSMSLILRT